MGVPALPLISTAGGVPSKAVSSGKSPRVHQIPESAQRVLHLRVCLNLRQHSWAFIVQSVSLGLRAFKELLKKKTDPNLSSITY